MNIVVRGDYHYSIAVSVCDSPFTIGLSGQSSLPFIQAYLVYNIVVAFFGSQTHVIQDGIDKS